MQTKRSEKLSCLSKHDPNIVLFLVLFCFFFSCLFFFFPCLWRLRNSEAYKSNVVFNLWSADFSTSSELFQKLPELFSEESRCNISIFKCCCKGHISTVSKPPDLGNKKTSVIIHSHSLSFYPKRIFKASFTLQQVRAEPSQKSKRLER